jgi:epoxyqueuosine reductase
MPGTIEMRLKERARALGFELVGIAPATSADAFDRLRAWLDRDFAGAMAYMDRQAEARRHPASILPAVRSVVMVGLNYHYRPPNAGGGRQETAPNPTRAADSAIGNPPSAIGRVATYALGKDYHNVLRSKLNELLAWVQAEVPGTQGRGVVDTAPLLERDFARRAGLGWFGKNTMLIDKRLGSFFFLGALLLDLALQSDTPFDAAHCGTCTACLDACPTQAFAGPYQLDARKCISYLTIELRGAVPEELRSGIGDWLFGCDVCQDVCPWNRKAPLGAEPELQPRGDLLAIDPVELLGLDESAFRRRFRGTALWRAKRQGLLRNAALALGNRGDEESVPALERALADPDPVVRDAVRWALDLIAAARLNPR